MLKATKVAFSITFYLLCCLVCFKGGYVLFYLQAALDKYFFPEEVVALSSHHSEEGHTFERRIKWTKD